MSRRRTRRPARAMRPVLANRVSERDTSDDSERDVGTAAAERQERRPLDEQYPGIGQRDRGAYIASAVEHGDLGE